ncbi:hypothetical protein Bca101_025317 [Brassica carinata]
MDLAKKTLIQDSIDLGSHLADNIIADTDAGKGGLARIHSEMWMMTGTKALKEIATEKDAAVVSREDLSAQLLGLLRNKRVKEAAEEEQYRAEEDAASLRAEHNSIQQQAMGTSFVAVPPDQVFQKEMAKLKLELQCLKIKNWYWYRRFQVYPAVLQKYQNQVKKDFQWKIKKYSEKQLHDMAVAFERLESSRQKLLMEVDNQSSEIEKVFWR